jgi:hypothetical protein
VRANPISWERNSSDVTLKTDAGQIEKLQETVLSVSPVDVTEQSCTFSDVTFAADHVKQVFAALQWAFL